MNLRKTHLESCGWQSVAIHHDHVMLPSLKADDRGWTTVPFGVGYLAPRFIEAGDEFSNAYLIQTASLV